MFYIILFALTVVSGIVHTVTGFGSAIIIMLLLPYYLDTLQAAALASTMTVGITAGLAYQFRDAIRWRALLLPTAFYEISSILVLNVAGGLDTRMITIAFGVFLIAIAAYYLFAPKSLAIRGGLFSAALCGIVSGACSALFGIGGPLMALYFMAVTEEKKAYVATLQSSFAITTMINLFIRIQKGFYQLSFLPLTILGIVAVTLGKVIGVRILDRINIELMKKLIYCMVGACGVLKLVQAL